MLVALEFSDGDATENPTLSALREELWNTGQLDVLYRVQPAPNGAWELARAYEIIETDLGPWIKSGQLLWWQAADSNAPLPSSRHGLPGPSARDGKQQELPEFAEMVNIPVADEAGWRGALAEVFSAQLTVTANVTGATVTIDDISAGPLDPDFHLAALMPGEYKIRVEKEGYAPFEARVTLAAGAEETVRAVLEESRSTGGSRLPLADARPQPPDLVERGPVGKGVAGDERSEPPVGAGGDGRCPLWQPGCHRLVRR